MEKRLKTKLDAYVTNFKREVVEKIRSGASNDEVIQTVMEYRGITLDEKDFLKRKRSNNIVPVCEKCVAKRMDGTQCTRRKQGGTEFCGTHIKGTPKGVIEPATTTSTTSSSTGLQTNTFLQEINGILYYIDNENKVYKMEDIMSNKPAKVIAYYRVVDGKYFLE